jgi:hypothetical protein
MQAETGSQSRQDIFDCIHCQPSLSSSCWAPGMGKIMQCMHSGCLKEGSQTAFWHGHIQHLLRKCLETSSSCKKTSFTQQYLFDSNCFDGSCTCKLRKTLQARQHLLYWVHGTAESGKTTPDGRMGIMLSSSIEASSEGNVLAARLRG